LKSVNKRIAKAEASVSDAKTTVSKLEKQIKAAKLEKMRNRTENSLDKAKTKLQDKLSKMASKGGKYVDLVAEVRKKMSDKLSKIDS
jgi:predicted  nucleic acid-binding Zn-ribbon protein